MTAPASQQCLGDDDEVWNAIETLDRARNAHYQRTGHYNSIPLTEVLVRASRYLSKIPGAISGQRGHDATFHVAMVLVRGFGIHPDAAMQVFQDWNTTCDPPWSFAELQHKLWSAHRKKTVKLDGYLLRGSH
jgi:hypothetical protein